jgi:hypothetical protein
MKALNLIPIFAILPIGLAYPSKLRFTRDKVNGDSSFKDIHISLPA